MADWWWSWLLTLIGITGLWLVGNKHPSGFVVGLSVQALWITYAVTTVQWGFIASALAYGAVNGRNLRRWLRDRPPSNPSDDGRETDRG